MQLLVVSFVGFETKEVPLTKSVNYNFKIQLSDGQQLSEVVIYTGKTSKKNNPALDILRKIWERKRKNGLKCLINTKWRSMKRSSLI
jgi:hypothetical protein